MYAPCKGEDAYGHDECVLAMGRQLGCDFVGLQEPTRTGIPMLYAAGYRVYGVGLSVTP